MASPAECSVRHQGRGPFTYRGAGGTGVRSSFEDLLKLMGEK